VIATVSVLRPREAANLTFLLMCPRPRSNL
jgi:hypothetical protein